MWDPSVRAGLALSARLGMTSMATASHRVAATTIIVMREHLYRPFSEPFPRAAFFLHPVLSPRHLAPALDVSSFRDEADRLCDRELLGLSHPFRLFRFQLPA